MIKHKRKYLATIRRRVDDGDEEGGPDVGHLDDDSFSEDSMQEDDVNDPEHEDSGNSVLASPTLSEIKESRSRTEANQRKPSEAVTSSKSGTIYTRFASTRAKDLDMMLNGLNLSDEIKAVDGVHFDELSREDEAQESSTVTRSTARMDQPIQTPYERRKKEHEEYKKKRLEDPAFVPNRGAFFMHDHRNSGPAANGFRPFSRGRGRGRQGFRGSFSPNSSAMHSLGPSDAPWTHDMHEVISESTPIEIGQSYPKNHSNPDSQATISASKAAPSSRPLSVTKSQGIFPIRIAIPSIKTPIVISGISVMQYTRLPDHRPPLRRDKPVRISLPNHSPRYIFPAVERSFVFIPRALRPNQQGFGGRRRGRSVFGTSGGFSRRTSIFGGSIHESGYSHSAAPSRRSSLAHETNRDVLVSPTGSAITRSQIGTILSKPVVRLPPLPQDASLSTEGVLSHIKQTDCDDQKLCTIARQSDDFPLPLQPDNSTSQPTLAEDQSKLTTVNQPGSQEPNSLVDIETTQDLQFNPPQQHQQPFHQQVPTKVNGNNYSHEAMFHSRSTSIGTPFTQIPERAIHAQPFQPNPYHHQQLQQQQQQLYLQQYQSIPQSHAYYCSPTYQQTVPNLGVPPPYVQLQPQQTHSLSLPQTSQAENLPSQSGIQSLVAQEVNGTMYYYDAALIPNVTTYPPAYQQYPPYQMQQVDEVGMGLMNSGSDGFYYTHTPQGVMYHPQ